MAKCVYCKNEVSSDRAMQICDSCGVKVWGPKMFQAILDCTKTEQEKGNMELGRVSESTDAGSIQELHKNLKDLRR
jgi:hypothetical protein